MLFNVALGTFISKNLQRTHLESKFRYLLHHSRHICINTNLLSHLFQKYIYMQEVNGTFERKLVSLCIHCPVVNKA
jgi:hypothetical protein